MMEFRPATIGDLQLLKYWDKKPHIIACDPDDDWHWESELTRTPEWREQWIAEIGKEPIGIIQIIDPNQEETHYWGEITGNKKAIDIWIGEEENLNKGYGTIMMKHAIDRCFKIPDVDGILIDPLKSNTKAHRFYEKLGFKFLEERKFDDSICFVYELKRSNHEESLEELRG